MPIPAHKTIQASRGQYPAFNMARLALITWDTGFIVTKIRMKWGKDLTGTKAFERNTNTNMVINDTLSTNVGLLATSP